MVYTVSMTVRLSEGLTRSALRLAGARPDEWLCPVCGAVVRDCDLIPGVHAPGIDPPVHEHHGRYVDLIWRAQL